MTGLIRHGDQWLEDSYEQRAPSRPVQPARCGACGDSIHEDHPGRHREDREGVAGPPGVWRAVLRARSLRKAWVCLAGEAAAPAGGGGASWSSPFQGQGGAGRGSMTSGSWRSASGSTGLTTRPEIEGRGGGSRGDGAEPQEGHAGPVLSHLATPRWATRTLSLALVHSRWQAMNASSSWINPGSMVWSRS